jgi:hypothetical protein
MLEARLRDLEMLVAPSCHATSISSSDDSKTIGLKQDKSVQTFELGEVVCDNETFSEGASESGLGSTAAQVNAKDKYDCSLRLTLQARREVRHWQKMARYWERRARAHEGRPNTGITPSSSGIPELEEDPLSTERKEALLNLIERRKVSHKRRTYLVRHVGHHRRQSSLRAERKASGLILLPRDNAVSSPLVAIGEAMQTLSINFPSSSSGNSASSVDSTSSPRGDTEAQYGEGKEAVSSAPGALHHPASVSDSAAAPGAVCASSMQDRSGFGSLGSQIQSGSIASSAMVKNIDLTQTTTCLQVRQPAQSVGLTPIGAGVAKTPPRPRPKDPHGDVNVKPGKQASLAV